MELQHNKENLLVEAWEGNKKVGTIITTGNIIMDPSLVEEVLAEEAKKDNQARNDGLENNSGKNHKL